MKRLYANRAHQVAAMTEDGPRARLVCLECRSVTRFTRKERMRRAVLCCAGCGSHALVEPGDARVLHLCVQEGCTERIAADERYCPAHAPAKAEPKKVPMTFCDYGGCSARVPNGLRLKNRYRTAYCPLHYSEIVRKPRLARVLRAAWKARKQAGRAPTAPAPLLRENQLAQDDAARRPFPFQVAASGQ